LEKYRADMHIHTCLSPCGDWEMSPRAIVKKSRSIGLDIIAICDHNSMENAGAAIRAGHAEGVYVIPGMEICSREEVHAVALFETVPHAMSMQEFVQSHLPGENDANLWGDQIIVDENNEVLKEDWHLLIGATELRLEDIIENIHARYGICIASHIDRPAFGVISNLGFIPEEMKFDALEISPRMAVGKARREIPGADRFPCVSSSDAHFIEDIGKTVTNFLLKAPTFGEIRMALAGEDERCILYE